MFHVAPPPTLARGRTVAHIPPGTWWPGWGDYSRGLVCNLTLIAPQASMRVRLAFSAFSTEATTDVLRVYDSDTAGAALLTARSGAQPAFSLNSTGQTMTLSFESAGTGAVGTGCVSVLYRS
jgi:hypothetical protein